MVEVHLGPQGIELDIVSDEGDAPDRIKAWSEGTII